LPLGQDTGFEGRIDEAGDIHPAPVLGTAPVELVLAGDEEAELRDAREGTGEGKRIVAVAVRVAAEILLPRLCPYGITDSLRRDMIIRNSTLGFLK